VTRSLPVERLIDVKRLSLPMVHLHACIIQRPAQANKLPQLGARGPTVEAHFIQNDPQSVHVIARSRSHDQFSSTVSQVGLQALHTQIMYVTVICAGLHKLWIAHQPQ